MGIDLILKREFIMNVRIYCRASTEGQHADRALVSLREFAQSKNWSVAGEYVENASGAKLDRVELMHLLVEAQPGDLLLIEEKSLACGFTHYKPDLVVFQFGVNESENLARKAYITPESYRKNLEDVIVRFKKVLPEANLLLISPIERISGNEKGEMRTMPEILLIRDTLSKIKVSPTFKCFSNFSNSFRF